MSEPTGYFHCAQKPCSYRLVGYDMGSGRWNAKSLLESPSLFPASEHNLAKRSEDICTQEPDLA